MENDIHRAHVRWIRCDLWLFIVPTAFYKITILCKIYLSTCYLYLLLYPIRAPLLNSGSDILACIWSWCEEIVARIVGSIPPTNPLLLIHCVSARWISLCIWNSLPNSVVDVNCGLILSEMSLSATIICMLLLYAVMAILLKDAA